MKKTKQNILSLLLLLIITLSFNNVNADSVSWWWITIIATSNEVTVNKGDILSFYADYYSSQIPESYKYINVNYIDVSKWWEFEDSLKKLIYLDLIDNPSIYIKKDSELSAWAFFRLSEKILWINIVDAESESILKNRITTSTDIKTIKNLIWTNKVTVSTKSSNVEIKQKIAIMDDVYKTLTTKHYNKDELNEGEMIDSAIDWLTKWTDDKHTVYFPPLESESFTDALSGDYEWIWAYVEMEKPGVMKITSPIPWSPSEKAWIKWWDIITKVDWKEIWENNSLKEVVWWIKWPSWTSVTLTINRNWELLEIMVTRDRIIITDIEWEILNTTTYYLQIKSFWENVSDDFKKAAIEINENKDISKIIIDLRNNWGWYLTEVTEMLSYFIEKWETTAVVKYHDSEKTFISKWYNTIDFSKYTIIILQNSWTASASEILTWTLNDYYSDLIILWEKSYGKWSVQVMKTYSDWSLLKYTIAKWFTWKTQTWIDWIWINPTIELELDIEKYQENGFDNQLDKAIFIN